LNHWSSGLGVLALALLLGFASPSASQQRPGPPPPPPPVPGQRPPPPPPPLDRAGITGQINRTQHNLAQQSPVGTTEEEIFSEANTCLQHAQKQLARNQVFTASRLAAAAAALSRALDGLQRREDPVAPPLPPRQDLRGRLIEVYFRVRQADYFSQESPDKNAKPLAELARRFYELARQAFDRNQARHAEYYAGAAEDLVQALEFLAQSAVGASGPPPLAEGGRRKVEGSKR
jgi:hypothetical protein